MGYLTKNATYILALVTSIFSAQALSYDAVFNVTGRVSSNTCSLSSDSTMNVNLGDHYIGEKNFGLHKGSFTPYAEWKVKLNCDKGTKIYVYLKGDAYPSSNNMALKINNTSGSATGVGILTEYSTTNPIFYDITLNKKTEVTPDKVNGNLTISFRSKYSQVENSVTPGTANASMTLDITYN